VADDAPTGAEQADAAWRDIMTLVGAQRQRVAAAAAAEGLAMPQAFALLHIDADAPGAMRDLAGHLHCDASFVTTIVDRLEGLGLAERRTSARDRRVKELVLTVQGRAARERLRAAWLDAPEAVRALGERDLRDLRRIARKMTQGLEGDSDESVFARLIGRRGPPGPGAEPPARGPGRARPPV
jgi:DNA-binding MarR family transcriptional regulator